MVLTDTAKGKGQGRIDRRGSSFGMPPGRALRTVREPAHAIFLLLVACACANAAGIACADAATTAAIGETVRLSGYSYGSTTVYLFLTGPNLPAGGVSLDDMVTPAGSGGLTRVTVGDQHRWEYDWDTTAGGTILDPGTYTVWITTEPGGRAGLRAGEYSTLPVTLRNPGIFASAPEVPGSAVFFSVPGNASVTLNGQYRGMTPLEIRGLLPGTYNATISRYGYRPVTRTVTILAGSVTEVNESLRQYTGSVSVVTDPPEAVVFLDGNEQGISPLLLEGIAAGSHVVRAEQNGLAAEEMVPVPAGGTVSVALAIPSGNGPSGTPSPRAGNDILTAAGGIPALAALLCLAGYFRHR